MSIKIKEAIVVEGRYDAARLRQVVETTVVQTDGFGVFRNKETLTLLRRLAAADGLIVLTDSDSAGFVIRDRISSALPKNTIKQAYIPEIVGKERRKSKPSKEGLLGVEGQENEVILNALLRAGATVEGKNFTPKPPFLNKVRAYQDGLSGTPNSAARRKRLLQLLQLPQKLSTNRLLEVCNALLTEEEYSNLLQQLDHEEKELSL